MSSGPYAESTATGTAWPQGRPTDPDEWTEDELNAWIDDQLAEQTTFWNGWISAERRSYRDGAAW